jgi:hypothetical protein
VEKPDKQRHPSHSPQRTKPTTRPRLPPARHVRIASYAPHGTAAARHAESLRFHARATWQAKPQALLTMPTRGHQRPQEPRQRVQCPLSRPPWQQHLHNLPPMRHRPHPCAVPAPVSAPPVSGRPFRTNLATTSLTHIPTLPGRTTRTLLRDLSLRAVGCVGILSSR